MIARFFKENKYLKIILIGFGLIYLTIAFFNHYLFRSFCFDYGVYNFALFDYSHFRISECPIYLIDHANFLQDHVSFTFMLFIPIYWLFNGITGTYTLLFIQVFFILFGGWATYKYIEFKTSKRILALLALLQYLIIYGRWTMFDTDVNLAIIASSMIPVFFYFFESKKLYKALLAFLFILISREDMALWTMFIGIFLFIAHFKDKLLRNASITIIAFSLFYFIFVFKIFIPLIETEYKKYDLFNYSALGANPAEAIQFIITHPIDTFLLLINNNSGNANYDLLKFEFYFIYLISGGFLLFYRPHYLLLFIPILAKKMFNDNPLRWSSDTYYSIEFVSILPIVVFSIINDIKKSTIQKSILIFVCVSTLAMTVFKLTKNQFSSFFWMDYKHAFYKSSFYKTDLNISEINKTLKSIPDSAKISATETIVPHLSFRKVIYCFPEVKDANYIVVFRDRNFYPVNSTQFNYELDYYLNSANWVIEKEIYPLVILRKEKSIKQKLKTSSYVISANIESITSDGMILSDTSLIFNGSGRSNEKALSGSYSIKLSKDEPFGLTTILKDIYTGTRIDMTVWCKSADKKFALVATSVSEPKFESTSSFIVDKNEIGWIKIQNSFIIPEDLPQNQLKVYIWYFGQDQAYFDDLEIKLKY